MTRGILIACLPWLGALGASLLVAVLLLRLANARPRWSRVAALHRDEAGAVQSLSFVLTLPLFIMVLMLIVQVSQVMVATVVVHYAAFAAARAAAVRLPADLSLVAVAEGPNEVRAFGLDPEADQQVPAYNPGAAGNGPTSGGVTLRLSDDSVKFQKIVNAAILACVPIAPSRAIASAAGEAAKMDLPVDELRRAYETLAPSASGSKLAARLANKLDYAAANTAVEVRVYHPNSEPPLAMFVPGRYDVRPYPEEYAASEIGWRDVITVTVRHNLALLPGPGRLLAKRIATPSGADRTAERIEDRGDVYVMPLSAEATIGNEGEKPLLPFSYDRIF